MFGRVFHGFDFTTKARRARRAEGRLVIGGWWFLCDLCVLVVSLMVVFFIAHGTHGIHGNNIKRHSCLFSVCSAGNLKGWFLFTTKARRAVGGFFVIFVSWW
jgi:hypothetical protein